MNGTSLQIHNHSALTGKPLCICSQGYTTSKAKTRSNGQHSAMTLKKLWSSCSNGSYSLLCTSLLGLPYRILSIEIVKQKKNYNGDHRKLVAYTVQLDGFTRILRPVQQTHNFPNCCWGVLLHKLRARGGLPWWLSEEGPSWSSSSSAPAAREKNRMQSKSNPSNMLSTSTHKKWT